MSEDTIKIKVPTNPVSCYAWTRNGCPPITRIDVWQAQDGNTVYIEGINRRGSSLPKSGFMVETSIMDELARQWLEARGYTVTERK